MSTLRAVPRHILSKAYIVKQDEQEVASVSVRWLNDDATTVVDGREMKLHREGWFTGAFQLELDGEIIARAYKPSAFRNRFEIELQSVKLVLERPGLFSRSFVLKKGDEELGYVERESIFTRSTRIDLPGDWPLALQLFVFWLCVVIWNRMQRST